MKILNKPGVYCIYNPINNKIYIGSSKNIRTRYANYLSQSKPNTIGEPTGILKHVFKKYNFNILKFKVLKYTDEYLEWEDLLIRLLTPEYNSAGVQFTKLQPNLGKKFSKQWRDKLGKSRKHSKEVREKLSSINKSNACNVKFSKDTEELNFSSWVEAAKHFNTASSVIQTAFKKSSMYKGWNIIRLNKQKKKVTLSSKEGNVVLNSASECDKFLDLWRGATSNAIRNHSGILHNYKVEYV